MNLIGKYTDNFEAEYIYEHNGYIIKENYYREDDCTHHNVYVYKDGEMLIKFKNLEDAEKFVKEKSYEL